VAVGFGRILADLEPRDQSCAGIYRMNSRLAAVNFGLGVRQKFADLAVGKAVDDLAERVGQESAPNAMK
jgi:hypothetical protein